MTRLALRRTLLLAAALSGAGCSDSAGGPSGDPQVNFNLATRTNTAPALSAGQSPSFAAAETITDGTNTLTLDRVDVVLREIELKRSEATADCGQSSSSRDSCERLELGPMQLSLPLGTSGAARAFSVTIAPGTYREVEFKVQSVSVAGSFNGVPFNFASDVNAEEEIDLEPALVVAEAAATDLTLFVDLGVWFRDGGGTLIDPATAGSGGANEALVKENIRRALHAFEDHDHNGEDDHGHHGEGGDDHGGGGNGNDDGPNHT